MAGGPAMYHYLYKITCLINQRYYIGMHSTERLDDNYLGSGLVIRKSIKKHGAAQHVKEILIYCSSREELKYKEQDIVNETLLKDPLCMNLKIGGEGGGQKGLKRSTATKINMSRARREMIANGWKMPKKSIDKMKSKLKSRKHTLETKRKMSNMRRGKTMKPFSDEHKNKLSIARKKRIISDVTKARISASLTNNPKNKGWQLDAESRQKQIEATRRALSKKPKMIVSCPHCGKVGGKPAMIRFHFDNCKIKGA
jgi:hypothetical protein